MNSNNFQELAMQLMYGGTSPMSPSVLRGQKLDFTASDIAKWLAENWDRYVDVSQTANKPKRKNENRSHRHRSRK